jgi:hypothetical protein
LKRTTKVTLVIMGAGVVTLGTIAAIRQREANEGCKAAGTFKNPNVDASCAYTSGHWGGAGVQGRNSGAETETSARGGFGETGGHASGGGE